MILQRNSVHPAPLYYYCIVNLWPQHSTNLISSGLDWLKLGTCCITTACVKQVVEGDNTSEKPMWAAHGGLDFDGRENWDQWTKLKVCIVYFDQWLTSWWYQARARSWSWSKPLWYWECRHSCLPMCIWHMYRDLPSVHCIANEDRTEIPIQIIAHLDLMSTWIFLWLSAGTLED